MAKLNASYPDQKIEPATAREWYDELGDLEAGDVWLAIRAHRRHETFRPGIAAILGGVAIHREDMALALAAQQRAADQLEARRRRGVPMPPETREALDVIAEATKLDTPADQRMAKAEMVAALADQLEARTVARTLTVSEATRTCGACATSPTAGFVTVDLPAGHPGNTSPSPLVAMAPCPLCRPARRDAWQRGRLADKADTAGWVKGARPAGAA